MSLYLGTLVQALAKDLLLPLIGRIIPGLSNLASISFTIGTQSFLVGDFLAATITFIIVAFVIFMILKLTKKWGIE